MVRITDNKGSCISRLTKEQGEMEEGMCHCQLYIKTKDESIQG